MWTVKPAKKFTLHSTLTISGKVEQDTHSIFAFSTISSFCECLVDVARIDIIICQIQLPYQIH